jgi:transposase
MTMKDVAKLFFVSISYVSKAVRRLIDEDDLDVIPRGGTTVELLGIPEVHLLESYVLLHPDAYLDEIQEWLFFHGDVFVSPAAISRALKALNLSRRQLTSVAEQKNRPDIQAWYRQYIQIRSTWSVEKVFFLDESGDSRPPLFVTASWRRRP